MTLSEMIGRLESMGCPYDLIVSGGESFAPSGPITIRLLVSAHGLPQKYSAQKTFERGEFLQRALMDHAIGQAFLDILEKLREIPAVKPHID